MINWAMQWPSYHMFTASLNFVFLDTREKKTSFSENHINKKYDSSQGQCSSDSTNILKQSNKRFVFFLNANNSNFWLGNWKLISILPFL